MPPPRAHTYAVGQCSQSPSAEHGASHWLPFHVPPIPPHADADSQHQAHTPKHRGGGLVYLQDTGPATTPPDRSSAATAAAPPPSTRGHCTRKHTDRHMARRGDLLPAPPGRRAEAHAHSRTHTHARSRTHAPTLPPARRHYTRAHTARHTAGQPTACAGRDAVPRHHAPTHAHSRTHASAPPPAPPHAR